MSNGSSAAKDESGLAQVSKADKNEIRAQLERILGNPLFQNSKRYPGFLRYVVAQTLDGRADQLKERTLGVQVFGREPDYDTSLDNVVRSTAGEIRRRLAQYYQEPAHRTEIRIDLPAGSYIPHFTAVPFETAKEPEPAVKKRNRWVLWAGLAAAACVAGFFAWRNTPGAVSDADRFWKPVLDAPGSVLLCVGSSSRIGEATATPAGVAAGATDRTDQTAPNRDLPISSATALTKIVGYLQVNGKPFRIRQDSEAAFADFRDGPAVLLGAFINQWTARLTGNLRFTFRKDGERKVRLIVDNHSQPAREWTSSEDVNKLVEDYALISRFLDGTTGKVIVAAGGLHRFGTVAAGEFLTDPATLKELAAMAPQGLEKQNLQVVLSTKVIGNNSGKPRIVAAHFW